jgi:ATP-dependent DNA helicase RecG
MKTIAPPISKSDFVEQQQLLIDFNDSKHNPTLSVVEIFDIADEKLLRQLAEDRRIERKPPTYHCKELGEYISMWANTGPHGGLIVVGMNDDGTIVGLNKEESKKINDFEKSHEVYAPDARMESKRIRVKNLQGEHDYLLLMRVHFSANSVILHSSGNAYIRIGDTKKKLTQEEILELRSDRGEISRELIPSSQRWPIDFNAPAINRFCETVRIAYRIEEASSNREILAQRRLGRFNDGKFTPNAACTLLFANDPLIEFPGCKIHFLRFFGREELTGSQRNVIKDVWFEGTIPTLIKDASDFIGSQLREFSALGSDGHFYSDPEYPRDAWYEALVNAVVHRSYGLKNVEITVRMFDDRLIVESPGGFPPTVTPANIYSTRYPRNPVLMDALLHFRYVKCSNEGAKRMRREMLEHQLPEPEFSEAESAFYKVKVTFCNNIDNRQPWVASERLKKEHSAVFGNLSENERRIMAFVAENQEINVSQAQKVSDSTWAGARKSLFKLVNQGLLIHRVRKGVGGSRKVDTKATFTLPEKPELPELISS